MNRKLSGVMTAVAVGMLSLAGKVAFADDTPRVVSNFNLPAQSLADSLRAVASETRTSVLFDERALAGKQAPALKGRVSADEAVARLLVGSGLRVQRLNDRTIVLAPANASSSATSNHTGAMQMAQVDPAQEHAGKTDTEHSQAQADENTQGTKLQEVVVTATKREERVQDVPISMAVISPQDIEKRSLVGMEDYLRSVPGVNEINRGVSDSSIVIRGITGSPESENFSSGATVATYFGETPITGAGGYIAGGIDVRPVDLERIEVLRGPQGTSFGSASLSGALRLIPKSPDLDRFSAKVAGAYSDTSGRGSGNNMIQGIVNIPLAASKLGIRVVGYRFYDSGVYRNIAGIDPATLAIADRWNVGDVVRGFTKDGVGDMESTGGRFSALWKATDNLSFALQVLTQKIAQNGSPIATTGEYEQARFPVAARRRVDGSPEDYRESNIDLYNLVVNYDLSWAVATATASRTDSAVSPLLSTSVSPFPFTSATYSDVKSFAAETRLASRLDGPFQFLGGLFYQDIDSPNTQYADWPGTAATNPLPLLGLITTDPLVREDTTRKVTERAIFGEVSYDLSDSLTATLGGRHFDYDRSEYVLQEGGFFGRPFGSGVPSNIKLDEGDQTFKANLSYRPTDRSLFYASWSQGFRLGRPAPGANPVLCDPNGDGLIDGTGVTIASTREISSDYLDSYEVGTKLALFDRRMSVDAAAYRLEWNDVPVLVFLDTAAGLQCSRVTYTANAGAARSQGVEFQTSTLIVDGLRVDLGFGYVEAELTKDAPALRAPRGSRLPGAPRVNANLGLQYDFWIAGHGAFVRADSLYAGEFYGDLLQTPGLKAGGYVKIDARAGIRLGQFSAELFARNLTNRNDFTWRGTIGGTNPFFGYRLRPRTVGIQLTYTFE